MLITCKACAAVNFIQSKLVKRGEAHCTICRKLIDITTGADEDQPAAFRSKPPPLPAESPTFDLEKKIDEMNSNQRLALAASYHADVNDVVIEDEEDEDLDMTPSIKLPVMDLARWNSATIPSIPAGNARSRLNQRLTLAAWMFVVGVGTVGVAGVAVAHATTTPTSEKKNGQAAPTATALLTVAAQNASPTKSR